MGECCEGSVSRAQVGGFRNAILARVDEGIIFAMGVFSPDVWKEVERYGIPAVEFVDREKLVTTFEARRPGVKPNTADEVALEFLEQCKV